MSDELPEGWAEAALGAGLISNIQTGFACGKHSRDGKGLAHLRPMNVSEGGRVVLDDVKFIDAGEADRDERLLRRGDVVFNNTNSPELVGKTGLYEFAESRAFSNHMTRLRCTNGVLDPMFCAFVLHHRWQQGYFYEKCNNHVSQASVGRDVLLATEVALPPLPEQRRIVEKVEALLEQVNRAKGRLDRAPLILKRFRQAVLAAACSGELTKEWREARTTTQTASALLAEIARRRAAQGLPTATRPIPDEDIEIPETQLPESWTWCRVGQIADVRLGGTPSRKEMSYWNGTVPWVSSGEVANCRISATAERITKKGLENSNAKLYPAGTVLIAMIGEGKTRGQSAILDIDAATNQNAAGLIFDVGLIHPEYIWFWALQEYTKNRDEGRGGNQPALNGAKVRALPVPLPPAEEQAEIVHTLKRVLAVADTIERRVQAATKRADKLPQAILSKAFSGELVPTEADLARAEGRTYETAEELLNRVKASGQTNGKPNAPSTTKASRSRRTGRRRSSDEEAP